MDYLLVFGGLLTYAVLSIFVVKAVTRHAQATTKSPRRWGWGAAIILFLVPFWDWLPTMAVHQYYCAKDSGFWVYKTLDQWKAENPGVAPTLVANKDAVRIENGYKLNQRFNWEIHERKYFPLNHMIRKEQSVVDSKAGEVLARYVDYSASHERPQAGWYGWKLWLHNKHCAGGALNGGKLSTFVETATNLGGKGK